MAIRDITDRRSAAAMPHSWASVAQQRGMRKFRQQQRLLMRKVSHGWIDGDAVVWPVRKGRTHNSAIAGGAYARWLYRRCADTTDTSYGSLQAEARRAAGSPFWQREVTNALRRARDRLEQSHFGPELQQRFGWLSVARWRDLPAYRRVDLHVARSYLNDRHLDVRPNVARQGDPMLPADNLNRLVTEGSRVRRRDCCGGGAAMTRAMPAGSGKVLRTARIASTSGRWTVSAGGCACRRQACIAWRLWPIPMDAAPLWR